MPTDNRDGALYVFTKTGAFLSQTAYSPVIDNPCAVGSDGTSVYVNQNDTPKSAYKADPLTGSVTQTYASSPGHGQRLGMDYWPGGGVLLESYDNGLSVLDPMDGSELQHFTESDLGQTAPEQSCGVEVTGDTLYLLSWAPSVNRSKVYVYTLDLAYDPVLPEAAKLLAGDGAEWDEFGFAAAISGDTVLVGAPWDDDYGNASGSAYVFQYDGVEWDETKLLPSDGEAGDDFGFAVAVDDDVAVISAYLDDDLGTDAGLAYVFRYTIVDGWYEEWKLLPSSGQPGDRFGNKVDVCGDIAVVGAFGADDAVPLDPNCNSGAAYVFRHDVGDWDEEARLTAPIPAPGDEFGSAVAVDGEFVMIGARFENNSGVVYGYLYDDVFEMWLQHAEVGPSDPGQGDEFGFSLDISGDLLVVGARLDDDNGYNSGSAYVFHRYDSGTPADPWDDFWLEDAKLLASDGLPGDYFGHSVAIDGDRIVVGACGDNANGSESGSAYVFRRDDNDTPGDPWDDFWAEENKLLPSDGAASDYFGWSVGLSGNDVISGTVWDDDNGQNSGSAYVFNLCFGDLNGDDAVNLSDLAQLLSNYGTTGSALYKDGDLDGDGDVDLSDLAALLSVYGTTCL